MMWTFIGSIVEYSFNLHHKKVMCALYALNVLNCSLEISNFTSMVFLNSLNISWRWFSFGFEENAESSPAKRVGISDLNSGRH